MNINLIKLKGVVQALNGIEVQLKRIADSMYPAEYPRPIMREGDPDDAEIDYRDNEMEAFKEFAKQQGYKIPGVQDPDTPEE